MNAGLDGQPSNVPNTHYERLVAALQKKLDAGAAVTWDVSIDGRQIDVRVEGKVGSADVLILVECRNYSDKIGVEAMEAWAEKARKLGAHKAIMVAASGYTNGALDAARDAAIDACVLKRANDADWEDYLRGVETTIVMMANSFCEIAVGNQSGEWFPVSQLDRVVDAEGKQTFVDRVVAYIHHSYGSQTGEALPADGVLTVDLVPPLRIASGQANDVVACKLRFRFKLVEICREHSVQTAPHDWVFWKVTQNQVVPEKVFLEFRELDELASTFQRGARNA